MAKIKGIDISYFQGSIDFKKVATDGIKFAVLREGYRKTIDNKFLEYAKECQINNINIMVYHFIYTNNATIKQNAQSTYNNIKKAGLDPTKIWIAADLEYDTWIKNGEKCTKTKCTKYTKEYLEELAALGCKNLFIYANTDYYKNYYDWSQLSKYPLWLADYNGEPDYSCVMQQYTSSGKVNGIVGNVDMDWLFEESMLTNTFTNKTKTINEIAKEVIDGEWGNGDERIKKLTEAGYDYQKVQNQVNNILLKSNSKNTTTTVTTTIKKDQVTAEDIINVMRGWIGLSRSAGTHKIIIDTYNNHKPLARGYKVTYQDAYCDTTISAAFIKLNAVDLIGGTECGVENHVLIFKNFGIWEENGNITPKPGYIIVYNWDDDTQPNDGYSDHIGIVESVSNGKITVIEGNMNGGVVGRRTIPIGWGYIRGYAKPKYKTNNIIISEKPASTSTTKSTESEKTNISIDYAEKFDSSLAGTYKTTDELNLRTGAGTSKNIILKIPKNATVNNYGYYTQKNNEKWVYIAYNGKTGFVNINYLKKNEKINQSQVQKLIAAAKNLNTKLLSDIKSGIKWTYTNKLSRADTFELARSSKRYRTNCVVGVQWAIQEAGILTNARGWYGKNGGTISWGSSKNIILSKFEDIDIKAKKTVNQLISEKILKPGDILTYVDMNHTNLYLGNNEWFDSGHAYCSETGENAAFKKWVGNLVYGQRQVGHILRLKSNSNNTSNNTTNTINKIPKCQGKIIPTALNVRSYAGVEYPNIKNYPYLKQNEIIEICDTIKDKNQKDWYYIRINKTIFGFVNADYIEKI